MQFIKFISNTLKISVTNLFHNFRVKESKKNISCNSFINKDLKLIAKKKKKMMFSTLKTMFKYEIHKIYVQYIKNICVNFIVFTSKNKEM